MTAEQPPVAASQSAGDAVVGDFEYDEAHDAHAAATDVRLPSGPVTVATETDESGGDYAYDMAHDVPRS